MGDPLTIIGAVGACAGLADLCFKICKSLNQMRGDFADAAESLEAVSSAVESFGSVLEQIGLQLDKGRAKGLEYDVRARLGLRNILDSCTTPLVNLQKILSKFSDFRDLEGKGKSSGIKVIMMRLRWMLEENRIVKIQKSVAQQKSTLQTQLLLVLMSVLSRSPPFVDTSLTC
jgi:hypothetical protein